MGTQDSVALGGRRGGDIERSMKKSKVCVEGGGPVQKCNTICESVTLGIKQ